MHIRDHWDAMGLLDGLKDCQTLLKSRATEGMNRGAVGLVVGGLEHQRDVQPSADVFVVGGATQCEVEIFKNVDPAKQGEGAIVGDGDVAELDLTRCHPVPRGQRSLPGS